MKYIILLMALSAGLMAQNTIFGKAGMPDIWDIITLNVDSIFLAESLIGDSAYISIDSLHFDEATGTNVILDQTTTANSYTQNILSEWTPAAAMMAGGSNGIYAICNAIDSLQNAYGLRARMDLRDATDSVDVNQLHAIDALINLNETQDYTVDDNISVIGGAIHGGTSGIIDGTGTGALGGATMNVIFGMWGPTATQDFVVETNFVKMISHAGTHVDYGLNIESSSDMDAGILLNNHVSNLPATMDVGIEMISAVSKMIYGIDMSAASFTGAEIRGSNSETIDNLVNGIWDFQASIAQIDGGVHLADDDSLLVNSDKYSLYIRQAAASAGDRDMAIVFVEEDGTEHAITWNDGNGAWDIDAGTHVAGYLDADSVNADHVVINITMDVQGAATFGSLITPDDGGMVSVFDRDVTGSAGAGVQQGEIFRSDTVDVLGVGALADGAGTVDQPFIEMYGGQFARIIEVTSNYTADLGDNTILVTDTLNITLPALSDAYASDMGLELYIKLIADAPCTLYCTGSDSLDNDVSAVLARWDCVMVQASSSRWVIK